MDRISGIVVVQMRAAIDRGYVDQIVPRTPCERLVTLEGRPFRVFALKCDCQSYAGVLD